MFPHSDLFVAIHPLLTRLYVPSSSANFLVRPHSGQADLCPDDPAPVDSSTVSVLEIQEPQTPSSSLLWLHLIRQLSSETKKQKGGCGRHWCFSLKFPILLWAWLRLPFPTFLLLDTTILSASTSNMEMEAIHMSSRWETWVIIPVLLSLATLQLVAAPAALLPEYTCGTEAPLKGNGQNTRVRNEPCFKPPRI